MIEDGEPWYAHLSGADIDGTLVKVTFSDGRVSYGKLDDRGRLIVQDFEGLNKDVVKPEQILQVENTRICSCSLVNSVEKQIDRNEWIWRDWSQVRKFRDKHDYRVVFNYRVCEVSYFDKRESRIMVEIDGKDYRLPMSQVSGCYTWGHVRDGLYQTFDGCWWICKDNTSKLIAIPEGDEDEFIKTCSSSDIEDVLSLSEVSNLIKSGRYLAITTRDKVIHIDEIV